MDEFSATMISLLESQRSLAVAMLNGYEADALGGPAPPGKVAELNAEIALLDAELAELRNG